MPKTRVCAGNFSAVGFFENLINSKTQSAHLKENNMYFLNFCVPPHEIAAEPRYIPLNIGVRAKRKLGFSVYKSR